MENIIEIFIYTTAAGACIPAGGLLAKIEHIHPQWLEREFRHFIIAFGGGLLLAAVAVVLIPEGIIQLSNSPVISVYVLLGGIIFFLIEKYLGRKHLEVPQLSAMLLDYLPESIALGGLFAVGAETAPLLAVLIGLQNLPEGFNAYRELKTIESSRPHVVLIQMCLLVPLGPVMGFIGWGLLSDYTYVLGIVMLMASGGILYLIFQDIAPQSKMRRHWGPPLGAVCGFSLALMGNSLINSL